MNKRNKKKMKKDKEQNNTHKTQKRQKTRSYVFRDQEDINLITINYNIAQNMSFKKK